MEAWFQDEQTTLFQGDSLEILRLLPSCSVQCVVTSPPYWALRDYGVEGQLGLEPTPEQYIENMVEVFREVRRVLREDGTLWLNIGDSYAVSRGASHGIDPKNSGGRVKSVCRPNDRLLQGYKPKDLIGVPWMLAFALRADGWYLRSEIIWAKKSPMPESVKDRPTKSHEQIFLLTKSRRYFYDSIGSQEQAVAGANGSSFTSGKTADQKHNLGMGQRNDSTTRNMRTVWSLASFPLKSAHFAAYPPELVRRCLSAGVSEKGCCSNCGRPWQRIVAKRRVPTRPGTDSKVPKNWATGEGSHSTLEHSKPENHPKTKHDIGCEQNRFRPTEFGNRDPQRHCTETITTGWKPDCSCGACEPVPCTVLDPFHGAGTSWKACQRLGLRYIGIELNPEYLKLSAERPSVHFPHERAKKSSKRKKKRQQMEIKFHD